MPYRRTLEVVLIVLTALLEALSEMDDSQDAA